MRLFLQSPARLFDLVFLVSFAFLLCSFGIGVYHSFSQRGQFPSVYDNYFEEGDRLFIRGDCGRAIHNYQIVTSLNREDVNAHLRLAFCFQKTKQKEEAKKSLDRALNLTLDREEPYFPLGLQAKRKGAKKGSAPAAKRRPPVVIDPEASAVAVVPDPPAEQE